MTNELMTNEPMKIGFDAKRAFLNTTGLGNYSRWLLKSLSAFEPGHEYHLYTPKTRPNPYLRLLQALPHVFTHLPQSNRFTSWWRTKGIVKDLKQNGIQLYHGLSHELPLGIAQSGIASVVTVHDVIALRFPQYFSWFNRRVYVAKLKYACRTANRIIAISEQTKQDIVNLLHINADKITVIYQNCDASFGIPASSEQQQLVRTAYDLPEQYLLTVGTIEQRKNLLLLIKALQHLPANIPLVVVGKPTSYLDEVKNYLQQHRLTEMVLFLHQVPFTHLPALYQMAQVFIYPSRYEGFGIPVLEALNAGVPVIAAKDSCLEEAGGPDSLYIDPDNEEELAQKIMQVLTDKPLRQHMISRGKQYAATFNDAQLAAQMITLYQQTLQHHA
ncbi:glycosyltransferase family 4 protein [Mucilaginibacter sp.]